MVEVFKTDIQQHDQAQHLGIILQRHFPACRIVFDLDDCDRILKISGYGFDAGAVQNLVKSQGFFCEALE